MTPNTTDDSKSSDRYIWPEFDYPEDEDRGAPADGVGRIEATYSRPDVDMRINPAYGWTQDIGPFPVIEMRLGTDQLGVSIEMTPGEAKAMIDRLQTAIAGSERRATDELEDRD